MSAALLAATVFFFGTLVKSFVQCNIWRPITVGFLTGIVGGNIQIGVMMGCLCEGIYMGVIPVGGTRASNGEQATIFATALAIKSGADLETAMALAVAAGILLNNLSILTTAITNAAEPLFTKIASTGNWRNYNLLGLGVIVSVTFTQALFIFLVTAAGAAGIESFFGMIPEWFMNGLSKSANVLVVVGLCLTAQSVWTNETPFWVILGFVLSKHVGLGTIPICLIAVSIAYFDFMDKFNATKNTAVVADATDGGDLFG